MKKKLTLMFLALSLFCGMNAEEKDVPCGSKVTVTVTPVGNYRFVQWSDGNTDKTRVFNSVDEAKTLVAYFTQDYTLTFTASEGGTVEASAPYTLDAEGKVTIEEGKSIIVEAKPNGCYVFEKWEDGNTQNPRTITANASLTATSFKALFKLITYKFNITSQKDGDGNDMGTITIDIAQN